MNLSVDFEELDNVAKVMDDNKSSLEVERAKLLASLERLKDCWQGDDLDQFYSKAYEYVDRMKVLTEYMGTTKEFIIKTNEEYQNQDRSFSEDLNKEAELLDEQNIDQYESI